MSLHESLKSKRRQKLRAMQQKRVKEDVAERKSESPGGRSLLRAIAGSERQGPERSF